MEPQDTITVAPSVLITMVRHAATQVDGVARMGIIPVDMSRLFSQNPQGSGVVLKINEEAAQVAVDLYIVTRPASDMLEISRTVQSNVHRAIHDLVGMEVTAVNVHIEDVADPTAD